MSVHLPKGTRDLLPSDMARRLHLVGAIRSVFERYGYEPLETPAFERIEVLLGKYGDDTDKLTFRIHKRGRDATPGDCDLALRYDLTVPLARFVAMHPELRLPFKRYQIQPVWRAERPGKGRYREFLQCDVDAVGTTSALADAECVAILCDALAAMGLTAFTVAINDRRILGELAARAGARTEAEELSALIALDKLDKIGRAGVEAELRERLPAVGDLAPLWLALERGDDNTATLDRLDALLGERGRAGVQRVREVLALAEALGAPAGALVVDPSLARGADYYTGPVFEATVPDFPGSVAGGGRYDGLVGMFAKAPVPAVGVSLGLDRLVDVLDQLGLMPSEAPVAEVLVTVYDETLRDAAVRLATGLRAAGIAVDLYVGDGRLKAQMKHANARGYPYVAILGPSEVDAGEATLKALSSGDQVRGDLATLLATLRP